MGCNCGGSKAGQRPRPPSSSTTPEAQTAKGNSTPTPSAPPATTEGK